MNELLPKDVLNQSIRLLVAEDHELSRNGLIFSLQKKTNIQILGEAVNGKAAVELALELQPDIILMDIGMPIMDGIQAARNIKQLAPQIKILMLTSRQNREEVYASLATGAEGYCLKDVKLERLVQIIQLVAEGAIYLDPQIAQMLMDIIPNKPIVPTEKLLEEVAPQYKADLTDREHEVLQLLVNGKSNQEIANILCVTIHTAKAHVSNIIQKLSVDDRTQAAVKALREGLVKSK